MHAAQRLTDSYSRDDKLTSSPELLDLANPPAMMALHQFTLRVLIAYQAVATEFGALYSVHAFMK